MCPLSAGIFVEEFVRQRTADNRISVSERLVGKEETKPKGFLCVCNGLLFDCEQIDTILQPTRELADTNL